MITKEQVLDKIKKIFIPNTGISAIKTGEVLSDIVNLSLEPFHFWTDKEPVSNKENILYYSFKGFKQQSINLTFGLTINNPSEGNRFEFDLYPNHQDELIKVFNEINMEKNLHFVIPVNQFEKSTNNLTFYTPWCTKIQLVENKLIFHFQKRNATDKEFLKKAVIFTSIHFHSPDFN